MIIIECQCNSEGTHGFCDKENGQCTCKPGYFGKTCESKSIFNRALLSLTELENLTSFS